MKKLNLQSVQKFKDYLVVENERFNVVFSTAEENRSFNRHTEEGVKTLNNLKNEFGVSHVVYLNQIHSDKVLKFNGKNEEKLIASEGDAIITNVSNSVIGVFTADCVPVILVDDKKGAVSAIHSGWKGTFKSITKKVIKAMEDEYGSNPLDIKAYIGAHIRQCCYEVSEELKDKFIENKDIPKEQLFKGRNLSMEECILKDLRDMKVKDENIFSMPLCTYCSKEVKLHSYRKSKGAYGRLFSFVIIK